MPPAWPELLRKPLVARDIAEALGRVLRRPWLPPQMKRN